MIKTKVILLSLSLTVWSSAAVLSQSVAPLRIGNAKQLFIDDYVIESRTNLTRTLHQPERYAGNPILVGSERWERWQVEVDGRAVVYDEETKEFKMYYVAPLKDPSAPTGTRYKTCYAFSKDGIHWTKPSLKQVEWEGSRSNNILKWGENWMRRPNVIKDTHDADPNRRFKMTYVDVMNGKPAITKAYSKDGIDWQINGDGKPWFRQLHNSNLLGWDPHIQRYVIYPRTSNSPNSVGRSTSEDFVTWSEPQIVLAPNSSEVGKDFKGNAAFLYEDVYLGWLWVFDRLQTAESELVFSRDGIKWHRVFPGEFFFPRGRPGSWDSNMILPVAPIIYRDKLWIYYAGWNIPYKQEAMERSESGWVENGQRMQKAIGLATLRLGGFVSLDAHQAEGDLVTKAFEIPGGLLTVNADVRGELRVEILDEKGRPKPGYTAADCDPIGSDKLDHVVRWKGKTDLNQLRGKSAKLRLVLRDGSLYAFGFKSRVGR